MPQRLYLGRLGPDATEPDVRKLFENYGPLTECRIMQGFGFVQFDSVKDAEDVVAEFNGKQFMGQPMIVELARENRRRTDDRPPRRDDRGMNDRRGPPPSRRPPGYRVVVSGISRDTSWQDLKDFGREAGNVSFADVDRERPGNGVLEYVSQDDADYAVKKLDGKDLRGGLVRVEPDRGGSWRDSGRDDGGGRGDRGGDRYRERSPRRSRSPPRRDDYRRRSRSPRPPRRDDDRRDDRDSRRDDPRRAPGEDKDRRQLDRRPDERMVVDREPRDARDAVPRY